MQKTYLDGRIHKTQLEIINDPAWKVISEVAKEAKALWEDSIFYELMDKPKGSD